LLGGDVGSGVDQARRGEARRRRSLRGRGRDTCLHRRSNLAPATGACCCGPARPRPWESTASFPRGTCRAAVCVAFSGFCMQPIHPLSAGVSRGRGCQCCSAPAPSQIPLVSVPSFSLSRSTEATAITHNSERSKLLTSIDLNSLQIYCGVLQQAAEALNPSMHEKNTQGRTAAEQGSRQPRSMHACVRPLLLRSILLVASRARGNNNTHHACG